MGKISEGSSAVPLSISERRSEAEYAKTFLGKCASFVKDESVNLACHVDSWRRDTENALTFQSIDRKDYST